MAAAQEFLDLWRSGNRQLSVLAKVGVRHNSTLAVTDIRAGTAPVTTPDGQFWPSLLLNVGPVNAPGGFGETAVQLCSGSITLSPEVVIPFQNFIDGAYVELWLWDSRLTDFASALPLLQGVVVNWSRDASGLSLQVRQRVNWNRDMTPVDVTAEKYPHAPDESLGQSIPIVYGRHRDVPMRRPWAEYPLITGGVTALPSRSAALVRGGRRAAAAIMVDTGRGVSVPANNSPAAKVLCASHKVRKVGDHTVGAGFYMDTGQQRLGYVEVVTPGTDIVNTLTEAGILLRDDSEYGWMSVWPTEVTNITDTMENSRALLDPNNENTFARADWNANYKVATLQFPSIQPAGELTKLIAFVGYRSVAHTNLQCRLFNKALGTLHVNLTGMPINANLNLIMTASPTSSFIPNIVEEGWNLSNIEMQLGWPTQAPTVTGTGTAEIYMAGFLIQYKPRQEIVISEQRVTHLETRPSHGRNESQHDKARAMAPYNAEHILPAVTEASGKFYANVEGWGDDGAGTYASEDLEIKYGSCTSGQFTINFSLVPQFYKDRLATLTAGDLIVARVGGPATGTVTSYVAATGILTVTSANTSNQASGFADITIRTRGALIERAPHIARHMLVNYGAEAIAKVENTPGQFGAFIDALPKLLTYEGRPMTHTLSVSKTADVMTGLSWIGQDSLSCIFLDRFTDKWRMRPWRLDTAVDYPWTFRPEDIVEPYGFRVSRIPLSHVSTGVEVAYSHAAKGGGTLHKARLAWDGSDAGQKWRNVRDESLTVSSANNKLPWFVVGAVGFVGTLTDGNYTPASFMAHVDAVMKAQDAARDYIVVHGATIVANYNDLYEYIDVPTATTHNIVVPAGSYSFTSLCAYLTTAINTALGFPGTRPIDVTYSFSNRKVMVATANRSMTQRRVNAPLRMKRMLATLGFDQTLPDVVGTAGFPSVEAQFPRYDQTFIVGTTTHEIQLTWENSVHGLNGSRVDCHSLLGFHGLRDSGPIAGGGGTGTCQVGDSPKGNREQNLRGYATRFGAKRDTVVDARTIQEAETARELRNRVSDLTYKPRVVVDFATEMAPDLERTRVIQFHPDMDAVIPYPDSDVGTSWQDKRFVVVETEQMAGPVAFYTKVRAVALQ